MIKYTKPRNWILYDLPAVSSHLADARATLLSLQTIPYQRSWVDALQAIQLKMEIAGTSRIEGAEFTERELDQAMRETSEEMATRSQRQARAALRTYRWIARLPDDRPITTALIREIHRYIVTDADDDHCAPGRLRAKDENVDFGTPRHRGCEGGDECAAALEELAEAIRTSFQEHDPLIGALAAHYHFGAMHPFADGNGRTGRALEALLLQRAGLRDTCFIAMSNYYYDEKAEYLSTLARVRASEHDLTAFIRFGLKGIATQNRRLLSAIELEMKKVLFKNMMTELSGRLRSQRKRVVADRQRQILETLLAAGSPLELDALSERVQAHYERLGNKLKALVRDLKDLVALGAVRFIEVKGSTSIRLEVDLEWPRRMTQGDLYLRFMALPKAKTGVHSP